MRRYVKNKNFIPENFSKSKEYKQRKNENKILTVFLIINLIFCPLNFKQTLQNKNRDVDETILNSYHRINALDLNKICILIENILCEDIDEAYISHDGGKITISDLNNVEKLNLDNIMSINEVSLNNHEQYDVSLILDE